MIFSLFCLLLFCLFGFPFIVYCSPLSLPIFACSPFSPECCSAYSERMWTNLFTVHYTCSHREQERDSCFIHSCILCFRSIKDYIQHLGKNKIKILWTTVRTDSIQCRNFCEKEKTMLMNRIRAQDLRPTQYGVFGKLIIFLGSIATHQENDHFLCFYFSE